jgi:signal transduction histidine kinase/CheY-like chemotaxis protein
MNVAVVSKGLSRAIALVAMAMLLAYAAGFVVRLPFPPPWADVAFLASGIALWIGPPKRGWQMVVFAICAAVVMAIGSVGYFEHIFGVNLGIDRFLFPRQLLTTVVHPGRPGQMLCANLILIAIELVLLSAAGRPFVVLREVFGVLAIVLAYLGLQNYLFATTINPDTAVWPVAAILCFLASASALGRGNGARFIRLLTDDGPGGELIRRLLPLPLIVPLMIEVTRLILRRAGAYGPQTAFILLSVEIIGPIYILWVSCARILRVDRKRQQFEEALRRSHDDLEERVQLRTSELLAVNRRLEVEAANRNLARKELEQINTILAGIIEACPLAFCAFDADGSVRKTNAAADEMLSSGVLQSGEIRIADLVGRASMGEQIKGLELAAQTGGARRIFQIWASAMTGSDGRNDGVVLMAADVSDLKALELQVRMSQKLESLGVLSAGIAHDFNNLLTGILGNTSLALDMLPPSSPIRALLDQAVVGSERAADLTRQLLAYAGKGQFVIRSVNLSDLVKEVGALARSSLAKSPGRNVNLRLDLAPQLPAIEADPSQIQQVVMNLVINAAEAIGDGGNVLVRTGSQWLESDDVPPGLYVSLEVTDDGIGMDSETQQKIFDPFFTTKFTGRGLGLAAVQGIVRSHKGTLKLESAPGRGTSFHVFFPAVVPVKESGGPAPKRVHENDESGTVLVIDDEDVVRKVAASTLKAHGYRVESAESAEAGIRIFSGKSQQIRIVLLDVTMPGVDGGETFRRLKNLDSDVKVVLSSGFSEAEVSARFDMKGVAGFLQKPYTSAELLRKIEAADRIAG